LLVLSNLYPSLWANTAVQGARLIKYGKAVGDATLTAAGRRMAARGLVSMSINGGVMGGAYTALRRR